MIRTVSMSDQRRRNFLRRRYSIWVCTLAIVCTIVAIAWLVLDGIHVLIVRAFEIPPGSLFELAACATESVLWLAVYVGLRFALGEIHLAVRFTIKDLLLATTLVAIGMGGISTILRLTSNFQATVPPHEWQALLIVAWWCASAECVGVGACVPFSRTWWPRLLWGTILSLTSLLVFGLSLAFNF